MNSYSQLPNLKIDTEQALLQLKILGYSRGDTVYPRVIVPDGDPRKGTNAQARNLRGLKWAEVERFNQDGYGIYIVVNGSGHKDEDVQFCRALFCEFDDRPVEDQVFFWRDLGLPEPSLQIATRKSVHTYWVFEQPIPVDQWRELQAALLTYTDSDQALKNPSRVMRLAGAYHIKLGSEPLRCEIIHQSGHRYSFDQLRNAIPVVQPEVVTQPLSTGRSHPVSQPNPANAAPQYQRYEDIALPVPELVPLEVCLSRQSRTLLASGVSKGGRNTNGAKLARDLIGTANYLQSIGQQTDGDPRQLLDEYASRCTPPLPGKEVEAIWKSAQKDNPSPSCKAEGVESCIRGWYWNTHVKVGNKQIAGTVVKGKSGTGDTPCSGDTRNAVPASLTETVTTVTRILEQGLPDWEEQAHLDALQIQSGISKASFTHLVAAQRCKFDEVLPTDQQQLTQLIEWKNYQLDFAKVLPHLAQDLVHDAQVLNIDPIMLWQYLLPATLSLVGKKVDLDANSHKVPAIAWTCSVGESGTGKSRAEGLVLAPLKTWQENEHHRFKAEWSEYKSAQNKKGEESGEEATAPVPERKYLFEVATIQAVMRRLSEQGDNGSLWARDEIAGLFKSLGQFNSKGEGEGLECLLPMWDGSSAPVDRVQHEDSYYLASSRLNIAGGIQPGVFRKIFQDPDDAQGLQARFLFALPKVQPAKRVKGACKLAEKLPLFYRWVDTQFPAGTIKLSSAADARYDAVYEQIGQQAEAAETPAIRAWMRKLPGQLLRIAIALHIIECYHEPGRSRHEIQLDTLNRAVELCRYYRSAFAVVQQSVSDSDAISSILLQIWDRAATTPGGLAVRDAYRGVKAIGRRAKEAGRQVAAYTIDLYYQLQKSGLGVVQQTGRLVKFIVGQVAPTTPATSGDTEAVTVVTQDEVQAGQGFLVSPSIEVSQVTEQVYSASNDTDVQDLGTSINAATPVRGCNLSNSFHQYQQPLPCRHSNRSSLNPVTPSTDESIALSALQVVGDQQLCHQKKSEIPIQVGEDVRQLPVSPSESTLEVGKSTPTASNLVALILQCQTWVEIVEAVQQDSQKFLQATKDITKEQRRSLVPLLATHLCQNPAALNELAWVPSQLRDRALDLLSFTLRRIGGTSILDACVEKISGCRFVSVQQIGTRHELWVFQNPLSGQNIPVFGIEAVEAIALA